MGERHRMDLIKRLKDMIKEEQHDKASELIYDLEQTHATPFLRTVIDTLPMRVFWKDLQGVYMGCNLAFAQDAGYSDPAQIIGLTDYDMSWETTEADAFRADDLAVAQSGRPKLGFEEPQTHPDGKAHWLRTNKIPLKNRAGQTIGVLGTYEDITERKELEAQLRQTQFAVDHLRDAAYWCNEQGQFVYVNQASVSSLGYSKEALLHMSVFDIDVAVTPDQWPSYWQRFQTDSHINIRHQHKRKDGSTFPVQVQISFLNFEGTQLACAFARDITEELEREEQLRQSQKMDSVGQLAGGIAHDLNNLLTPILGYSEMLLDEAAADPPFQNGLKHISDASQRARDLVQQLLAFSRKQEMAAEVLDLNAVLCGFEGLLRRTIREDVTLSCEPASVPLYIRGDRGQVEQIIMNLCVNAQDAMPRGGRLSLSLHAAELTQAESDDYQAGGAGAYAVLRVQDSGTGIPPEILEKIFDPFFTTKEVGAGTGLGLSTVFGIVKQHKGGLRVQTEAGHGALFELLFPLEAHTSAVPRKEDPAAALDEHPAANIWIVEDEETVRDMLEIGLQNQGHQATCFSQPLDALNKVEQHPPAPDLLITDIIMPAMDGTELARKLREIYPMLKVIYMSGYSRNKLSEADLPESAVFIKKPFSLKELDQTIHKLLTAAH